MVLKLHWNGTEIKMIWYWSCIEMVQKLCWNGTKILPSLYWPCTLLIRTFITTYHSSWNHHLHLLVLLVHSNLQNRVDHVSLVGIVDNNYSLFSMPPNLPTVQYQPNRKSWIHIDIDTRPFTQDMFRHFRICSMASSLCFWKQIQYLWDNFWP